MDDPLQTFATTGSHQAFRCLVDRHLGSVYSQCVRRLGDSALAEDVTQLVFVALAERAKSPPASTLLGGWLYVVTQHACINAKRAAARRREHERKAAQMRPEQDGATRSVEAGWGAIAGVIDDAIADLPTKHRDVIILRYLEGRSIAEVSQTLAVSEDAAKQRVSRALAQLRERLSARGVNVPLASLTAALGTHALLTPPAALAEATLSHSLVSAATESAQYTSLKGAIDMATRAAVGSKLRTAPLAALIFFGLSGAIATAVVLMQPRSGFINSPAPVEAGQIFADRVPVPPELVGEWEPVDPEARVHREDRAVVRLSRLTLQNGEIAMLISHTVNGVPAEKTAILSIRDVHTDTYPKTLSVLVTDAGTNTEGLSTDAAGQTSDWAWALGLDGILRIAAPHEGEPTPDTFDEGPGREVLILKRKPSPATQPQR